MIQIGRSFTIPELKAQGDAFVPVWFRCRKCRRRTRATVIDVVALDVAGGRIICGKCEGGLAAWTLAADVLGRDYRPQRKKLHHARLMYNSLSNHKD